MPRLSFLAFLALAALTGCAAHPGQRRHATDLSRSSHYASTPNDPARPTLGVGPLPHTGSFGPGGAAPACLAPTLSFACTGLCPQPLADAFDRYGSLIFFAGSPSDAVGSAFVTALNVTVTADARLALGVSENYTLTIPTGLGADTVAVLRADTQWGALRGLETFSQLWVWAGRDAPVSYCTTTANLAVTDFPRYPWRGLLIDSARHFLPVSAILKTLDAMSYNKLNTLHWHLVDDQSWPLYSANYPNFTKGGAYCPSCYYTHEDLTRVV